MLISCSSSGLPDSLKHEHSITLKKMEIALDNAERKVNKDPGFCYFTYLFLVHKFNILNCVTDKKLSTRDKLFSPSNSNPPEHLEFDSKGSRF